VGAPAVVTVAVLMALSLGRGEEIPADTALPHGRVLAFHADGRLASERWYDRGVKVGTHRAWWEDGTLRLQSPFRDGAYHGDVRSFYADGRPYEVRRYRSGEEDGPQQVFEPDGSLRANYVARDGRRYGVIGSRPCSTVREVSR
jgi:antitoxin component YwqK of YwqJK toxin-antitoxin module